MIKAKDPGSSSVMCPSCGRTKITFREKQLVDELQEKYGAELGLYIAEEQMCRELGDRKCVQKVLGLQADFHCRRGNLDEAMRLYEEKELICRELENQEGLAAALGGQAEVFEEKGDLDEAFQLYREKERIYRELEDNVGISMTLVQQALLLDKCGKSDKARARARDAYEIARLETSYLGNALREYVEENVGSLLH
ncbi:MAG: tetratricopeptide repeat protein [Halobacteriota archaeon]